MEQKNGWPLRTPVLYHLTTRGDQWFMVGLGFLILMAHFWMTFALSRSTERHTNPPRHHHGSADGTPCCQMIIIMGRSTCEDHPTSTYVRWATGSKSVLFAAFAVCQLKRTFNTTMLKEKTWLHLWIMVDSAYMRISYLRYCPSEQQLQKKIGIKCLTC